jgi:putative two-component system response regulator
MFALKRPYFYGVIVIPKKNYFTYSKQISARRLFLARQNYLAISLKTINLFDFFDEFNKVSLVTRSILGMEKEMKRGQCKDGKILIVNLENKNTKPLERMFSEAGFSNIVFAIHFSQALNLYGQIYPEIVILDLVGEESEGFRLMEELRKIEPSSYLPILVTTSLEREFRLKALKSGARDLLRKPFNEIELIRRAENIIEARLLHNEMRLRNDLLNKNIEERTKQLQDCRLEVIHRLGQASEFRDNETGMHIIRMSRLSAHLAKVMGMNDRECDLILNASPMHDVGKIGIPDNILLKPGKLTPKEWDIMKTHPDIGAEILSGSESELLKLAESIALTHQERWNGSGYPKGLKEKEIPIEGRLVALCDVFDALTSERPYKRAFSVEESMAIIEKNRGIDFDPELVDIFKENLSDMVDIIHNFSDERPDKFSDKS